MTELRVYTNPAGASARGGLGVFYSRRADGPFYRWHYDEVTGLWSASRVPLSKMSLRALNVANWQNVPTALQAKLINHYLD
jgi:hypothetical protein